jgi:hypothetical protein
VKDDGSYPNLALCCDINAHTNDIIVQQNIILIWRALSHFTIPTKGLKSTTFNDNFSMKFYTYIKETIKDNLSHQSFQFFLRSWNLDKMILKCSLVHYGMKMLMIMIFLGWKMFLH